MSLSKEKGAPKNLKIFMWASFLGVLSFSVWAGAHSKTASAAAQTSSTRTVTVNATVASDIEIYIADATINLNVTSPGSAVSDANDIEVWTNSENGYKLFQWHTANLTHDDASNIIDPNLTGTVDAPVVYAHNGLGFSLSGTPVAVVETIWNNGSNFSTFAATATECNCYAAYYASNTIINVVYRLDVKTTQHSGNYTNYTYWYAVTNGT